VCFNIRERRVSFYFDEGRPVRPVIFLIDGSYPYEKIKAAKSWKELVIGTLNTSGEITSTSFIDPLVNKESPTYEDYVEFLKPHIGSLEYIDPYESNEAYIATYPEQIKKETTHVELHPSTMLGLLTSMIPFPNHNQSPRNQLSCSQSKQGISVYSTNYKNRYDNQTHILSYGEAPLVRTAYYDYVADGQIGYGHNLVLAMGCFTGYNQEDGIVFNADSIERGLFRNITFRSYDAFEEDDDKAHTKTRVANPLNIPGWTSLKPGLDYRKLDERGIIKIGEYVDENTVIVGRYIQAQGGAMSDASVTPQVWTSGTVEDVVVTINNKGLALVKIRIIQDRVPELGDKFSNRHGQKGTIGMLVKGVNMPRSATGIVPDMIMNPHAIPSRMTIAQLLESLLGKSACLAGLIGDATAFMNEGGIEKNIGDILTNQFGLQRYGEEILYDGTTGTMIPSTIFMGNVYTMRLKHMVEDKWNARGLGRKEQRTHQPTGGRGNQGGLRIGEMERDALIGHGISNFLRESLMKRSDGSEIMLCNGCGTVPIYNDKSGFYLCSLCDGPVQFIGDTINNFELLPSLKRSIATFSKVEIPYSLEVLNKELNSYMNIYLRFLTAKDVTHLRRTKLRGLNEKEVKELLRKELVPHILKELSNPEIHEEIVEPTASEQQLAQLGVTDTDNDEEEASYLPELTVEAAKQQVDTLLDDIDTDDISVSQSIVQSQPSQMVQTMQTQPVMMMMPVTAMPTMLPAASMYQSQIPNAPSTLVVDTSAQAMQAQGLPTMEEEVRPRSILKRANSPSRFRSNIPTNQNSKINFSINKLNEDDSSSRAPMTSNTRINIVKEE
jgi:DNA-directed RNA polymerase beta subunit